MAIVFTYVVPEGAALLSGGDTVELSAGDHLIITAAGSSVLDFECPAGKTCRIAINVTINQS